MCGKNIRVSKPKCASFLFWKPSKRVSQLQSFLVTTSSLDRAEVFSLCGNASFQFVFFF